MATTGSPDPSIWPAFTEDSEWPVIQFDAHPALEADDSHNICVVWDPLPRWRESED